jgi:hypothetical protein
LAHKEAVRVEIAYEESIGLVAKMIAEQRQGYDALHEASGAAWDMLEDVSGDLVNTQPATLAGLVALCRYLEPLLNDPECCELPEYIAWDNDTESTVAGAFAYIIAVTAQAMIGGQA